VLSIRNKYGLHLASLNRILRYSTLIDRTRLYTNIYTIHRLLTPCISDTLSVCALYSGKNSENKLFIFGDISGKAKDLAEIQRLFLSPVNLLASTQTLFLYQIIRLFSGDIRQRGDTESHKTILISWTK
jgi:hypothetical protein